MPTCGGFRIGVLSSDPKTPPLVIVNVPPLISSSESVPSSARFAKSLIDASISPERHAVGVAQHGHDEARAGADGDADVVVVLQHHLVALDLGVDAREPLERADGRLHEERRQPEVHAVRLLEGFLPARAQRLHGRHVHLVEGGEHGRGVLRLDQALGDRRAALGHADAFFGTVPALRARRCRRPRVRRGAAGLAAGATAAAPRLRRRCRCRSRCLTACCPLRGYMLLHVLPRDAAAVAAAGDLREIHAVFLGDLSGSRRRTRGGRRSAALRPQARQVRRLRRRCAQARWHLAPDPRTLRTRRTLRTAAAPVSITPSTSPTFTSSPSWRAIFESTPADLGADLEIDLVGLELDQQSPAATASPSCFSQRAMRASITDSPS